MSSTTSHRHPLLALFRNEMFTACTNGMPVFGYFFQGVAWMVIGVFPTAALLLGDNSLRFAEANMYWQGISVSLLPLMWLGILGFHCPATLTNRFWDIVSKSSVTDNSGLEFMVTRAIDRRLHFRIKTLTVVMVMLGPLLLNLVFSLAHPDFLLMPDLVRVGTERYATVFPGSHLSGAGSAAARGEWLIKNGTIAFNCWLLALSSFVIVVAYGYYGIISRFVADKSKAMVFVTLVALPVLVLFSALYFCGRHHDLSETMFLFYWSHALLITVGLLAGALVVMYYCENRFAELEVL